MVMTYSRALLLFRNEVSKIHPPQMNNRSTRHNVNQVDSGRGRGSGRDTGRGGRGYHGGYSGGRGSSQGEAMLEVVVVDAEVEENPARPETIVPL
jgi:hypothetical protein